MKVICCLLCKCRRVQFEVLKKYRFRGSCIKRLLLRLLSFAHNNSGQMFFQSQNGLLSGLCPYMSTYLLALPVRLLRLFCMSVLFFACFRVLRFTTVDLWHFHNMPVQCFCNMWPHICGSDSKNAVHPVPPLQIHLNFGSAGKKCPHKKLCPYLPTTAILETCFFSLLVCFVCEW